MGVDIGVVLLSLSKLQQQKNMGIKSFKEDRFHENGLQNRTYKFLQKTGP